MQTISFAEIAQLRMQAADAKRIERRPMNGDEFRRARTVRIESEQRLSEILHLLGN